MPNYVEYSVAVISNGTRFWRLNGKLHREDGPAIEHADGDKQWYNHGSLHNENGPAVIHSDGEEAWFLNGVQYSEEEWQAKVNPAPLEGKVVEIDGKKYRLALVD